MKRSMAAVHGVRWGCVLLSALAWSCTTVPGGTGGAAATTTDTSSATGTTASAGCSLCAPAAPDGWSGPVVVAKDKAACDAPASSVFVAHDTLVAPKSCTGCKCEANPDNCGGVGLGFGNGSCGGYAVLAPGCLEYDLGAPTSVQTKGFTTPQSTTCVPSAASAPVPEPVTWETDYLACEPPLATPNLGCDGEGICLADIAKSESVCVHQAADIAACPVAWPVRRVVYSDFMDLRTCGACCQGSPAVGVECAGEVATFVSTDCSGAALQTLATGGTCKAATPGSIHSVRYTPASIGTCVVQAVATAGTAEPSGPITMCCLED